MTFWVYLLHKCQVSIRHVRRSSSNRNLYHRDPRNSHRNACDESMLKALSILLSDSEMNLAGPSRVRKGRQLGTDSLAGFEQEEVCEQTGFKTRKKEECNEVPEIECKTTEVTKFRMDIVSKCKTKNDQSCNITMREVPRKESTPTTEKR